MYAEAREVGDWALSTIQVRTFVEAIHGDRFEAFYVVAVHCELREGEFLGFRWEDLDIEADTLSVRRTLSETKERGHIFEPPKNGKGRSIKLTRTAAEALSTHSNRQNEERLRRGFLDGSWAHDPIPEGHPHEREELAAHSFKPIFNKAGLPDIRLHYLRHMCVTLLLSRGVHPKFVQELLGHANISITVDTSSNVLSSMSDQTVRECLRRVSISG